MSGSRNHHRGKRNKQNRAAYAGIRADVLVQRDIAQARHRKRKHARKHGKQLLFKRHSLKRSGKFVVIAEILEIKSASGRIRDCSVAETTQNVSRASNRQKYLNHG